MQLFEGIENIFFLQNTLKHGKVIKAIFFYMKMHFCQIKVDQFYTPKLRVRNNSGILFHNNFLLNINQ